VASGGELVQIDRALDRDPVPPELALVGAIAASSRATMRTVGAPIIASTLTDDRDVNQAAPAISPPAASTAPASARRCRAPTRAGTRRRPLDHRHDRAGRRLGIIAGGDICRGFRGGAGEFGHTAVTDDGPTCTCRKRGCLEALVSDSALVAKARAAGILTRR